ncbi:peptidase C13 family protein [Cooperia oncophora]
MEKLLRITSLTVLLVSAFSRDFIQPNGNLYAVLVAGSNGWYNYRHQADVAHSYHTLLEHGVKKENIIVMMYDDIANDPRMLLDYSAILTNSSSRNPYKGQLFNSPYGPDVYQGLNIDYRVSGKVFRLLPCESLYNKSSVSQGDSVNIPNFLAVLKGDATSCEGRKWPCYSQASTVYFGNSHTINDRIFVYFTDHGGSGIIAFPEGVVSSNLFRRSQQT